MPKFSISLTANPNDLSKKMDGFTLLELLLVAGILGVLATTGMAIYRYQILSAKVSRTALELQEILKNASTFYAHRGVWPSASSKTGDEFEENYLPGNKILTNAWGFNYQYQPVSKGQVAPEKIRLFEVATRVPTEGIAHQIAAQLSNAEITPDHSLGYTVRVQIVLPGEKEKKPVLYQIYSVGTRMLTKTASRTQVPFVCPDEMKPALFVGFERVGYLVNRKRELLEGLATFEIVDKKCHEKGCDFSLNMRYWGTLGCGRSGCWPDNAAAAVRYFAYCENKK